MEEIDISQLLNYFKSKVVYILFAFALGFCLSSIYVNRFRTPVFTSSTTILLNQANENVQISYNDISLNKSLVSTYGEIIKSKRVLSQVIEEMKLDYLYRDLYKMINVTEISDTSIIKISVTDEDSELASNIANSIATVFAREIVSIYNIENISIIDVAEPTDIPSSRSAIKIIGISSLAFVVMASAIIFCFYYFDTSIKNEEEVEKITGLPVIGTIPLNKNEKKSKKIK